MRQIEHLLRERIGLDAAAVGSTLIQRAVRLRMKSLGLKGLEDYERLLGSSPAEWNELVESVIVSETWFFRDPEPFSLLSRLVSEEWLPAHPTAPLRLLSIPCSSGEEPYSLAMALVDVGIPARRLKIDAVDISARALARAKRGIYGKNSFRGKDLAFRDRHFQPAKEGFMVNSVIRSCVDFSQGNLLSDEFRVGSANYDFIFCRNLLIYFDRPTQRRALERIERLLAPSGVLFVGPAEQAVVMQHGFISANVNMACAARRVSDQRLQGRPRLPAVPPALPPTGSSPQRVSGSDDPLKGECLHLRHADLETARRLADAGHLKEAARICEAHLRLSNASAHAYYLLGLVRDADGDPSAIDCYRKALYLEPNHYETLLQMALLSQRTGNSERARAFKSRAQRVKASA
jgi:chemotaxis protein methyltransferase WspC